MVLISFEINNKSAVEDYIYCAPVQIPLKGTSIIIKRMAQTQKKWNINSYKLHKD
jgi:hypothetical protein